jgi:very-short-patch-repair endonuclease
VIRPRVPRIVRAAELPERDLREALRAGRLVRVLRGCYAEPPAPGPPWEAERHLLLARASAVHCAQSGEHWFTGETAALLWGCALVHVPRLVDVTALVNPHVRAGRSPGVRRHWTTRAERAAEAFRLLDLPVSPLARTVVDCASSLPVRAGLVLADSALRAGTDSTELSAVLASSAGDRGVRAARQVVSWADGRSESPGESLVRFELLLAGLTPPELQVPVRTQHGWRWIDLGWREERVGIEFDGRAKYGASTPDVLDAVAAEKRRHEALEDQGWRILRLGWADLGDGAGLVDRVRRALRRATRNRTTL